MCLDLLAAPSMFFNHLPTYFFIASLLPFCSTIRVVRFVGSVFSVQSDPRVEPGGLGLNAIQRKVFDFFLHR